MDDDDTRRAAPTANPGYAVFQIARALRTAEHHADAATRERARQRIEAWAAVLDGLTRGTIAAGSRAPLPDIPVWATPEVVTGGFATGALMAGGPLHDHERALLQELSAATAPEPRRVLNAYFISDAGLARLDDGLRSGLYAVSVPEEGALPAVAWLAANGHAEAARGLLDGIAPFFDRLRFYPAPSERAAAGGPRVFLRDVGGVIADLDRIRPNRQVMAQKEAVEVWTPLYDRVVALFVETVEGTIPTLVAGPRDAAWREAGGGYVVSGGWPCRRYPEGWAARAGAALDDYRRQRQDHTLCGKPDRRKDSFARLRGYLERCLDDPQSLTGRDVGMIRLILARYVAKRGTPGSVRCTEARDDNRRSVSRPTFRDIATVVRARLASHAADAGLDDVDAVAQAVTPHEAARGRLPAGTEVPPALVRKLQRCLTAAVDALVERGIVTSADTLARLLPRITAQLRAAGIADPALRQLYAAIYQAFRRRRSLLLFDLQSQVRIEELPWVAAIDRFRRADLSDRELARQALEDVTVLAVTSFPQAIVPNKLLQELRALATTAEIDLPLVDEVAADIFMGRFSGKFGEAARRAADRLEGTLYTTYYGIAWDEVRGLARRAAPRPRWGFWRATPVLEADPFAALCARRAGVALGGWDPATNGMIIEQQQILTSQNLAVLAGIPGIGDRLRGQAEPLARRCFTWICRRLQVHATNPHARRIAIKNAAYAWRQMIFFLALLPADRAGAFLAWAEDQRVNQSPAFRTRFEPALRGLAEAIEGRPPDPAGPAPRCFLGWSATPHWLLA